jgi:hypothetical protein
MGDGQGPQNTLDPALSDVPVDETFQPISKRPLVAADPLNTRTGDVVYWVAGRRRPLRWPTDRFPAM